MRLLLKIFNWWVSHSSQPADRKPPGPILEEADGGTSHSQDIDCGQEVPGSQEFPLIHSGPILEEADGGISRSQDIDCMPGGSGQPRVSTEPIVGQPGCRPSASRAHSGGG